MKLLKENEKGKTYHTEECKVLYRKAGSISGDNSVNVHEVLYLVAGSAEITIEEKTSTVNAPVKIEFPAKTYHKITALTDITLIMFEK